MVSLAPKFIEDAIATTSATVELVTKRMPLVVILVVLLRGVESRRLGELGHDGFFQSSRAFDLRLRSLGELSDWLLWNEGIQGLSRSRGKDREDTPGHG